jgi:hypothetical protein
MFLQIVTLISFIFAALTIDVKSQKSFVKEYTENFPKIINNYFNNFPLYKCTYSTLWCGCYTINNNGCEVGCSPTKIIVLRNQTQCVNIKNYVLSGFEKE